jgi:protein-tyrosine-phosphatase
MSDSISPKPTALFLCTHNACRSQVALGLSSLGIDISNQSPKILTYDTVEASDVVITIGCGDTCPVFPGMHGHKRFQSGSRQPHVDASVSRRCAFSVSASSRRPR